MNCWLSLLFFAAALVTPPGVAATTTRKLYEWDPEAKNVIEFVGLKGGKVFENSGIRVVELYNPFCGHCIRFKPTYIEFADKTRKDHPEVEFHAISCLHHDDICRDHFEFGGYPALIVIAPGVQDNFQKLGVELDTEMSWKGIEVALEKAKGRKLEKGDKTASGNDLIKEDPKGEKTTAGTNEQKDDAKVEPEETEEETELENGEGAKESGEFVREESGDEEEETEVADEEEETELADEEVESGDMNFEEDESKEIPIPDTRKKVVLDGVGKEEEKFHHPVGDLDNSEEDEEEEDATSRDEEERVIPQRPIHKRNDKKNAQAPRNPKAGAALKRQKHKNADPYNTEFKKQLDRRNRFKPWKKNKRAKHPILDNPEEATEFMKANQVMTKEYQRRKQKYYEYLKNAKKKKKVSSVNPESILTSGKIGKLQFQKKVTRPKLIEKVVDKVPVVKRINRMSPEEELMVDVTGAFLHGMKFDVFRTSAQLSQDKIEKLMDWLDLLYISLPPEWSLQSLIYDLRKDIGHIAKEYSNLKEVLDKHPAQRLKWSKSCAGEQALACGYWKLLHVVTIGVAEHRGGLNLIDSGIRPSATKTFSPIEAADTIRNYVETFFFCAECSQHFVEDYDDCEKNRRCDRLAAFETEATNADWKELALWLWEFHNDVSLRLLHAEKDARRKTRARVSGPGMASPGEAIKVMWPDLRTCITCFNDDGSWNESNLFRHLEKVYWPGFDIDFNVDNRLIWFEDEQQSSQALFGFLVLALIVLSYYLRDALLSAPQVQRTILRAKYIGPAIARGPKERSL